MGMPALDYDVGDLTLTDSMGRPYSVGPAKLAIRMTGQVGDGYEYRVFLPDGDTVERAKLFFGAKHRPVFEESELGDPPNFKGHQFQDGWGGRIQGHFCIRDPKLDYLEKATGEPWVQMQPYGVDVLVENIVELPKEDV